MKKQESETLEYKSSFGEWKEIIQTLGAFANRKGGNIFVGLDDNGNYANLKIGKNTIEDFVNKIKLNTDPVLYPSINVKTFGPGEIVEIAIPESDNKPVFTFDKAFIRVGKSNIKLSSSELRKLIKKYTISDYDSQPTSINISEFEADKDTIAAYKDSILSDRENSFLEQFNIQIKNKISVSGYLCFTAKNTVFSNAIVKAARFKGETTRHFIDMKEFDSNLIKNVEQSLDFIKRHISLHAEIKDKAQRNEEWEYPLTAIREAVINAIVHRDYSGYPPKILM